MIPIKLLFYRGPYSTSYWLGELTLGNLSYETGMIIYFSGHFDK
jgi:hypothetical protein